MSSVNVVMLLGNVNPAPEVRYTSGGTAVMNFNMATTEHWRTESGEKKERTDWHKIVVWGKQAEILAEMIQKGTSVHVEGTLTNREWKDREDNKRLTTEIRAKRVQVLNRRRPDQA